MRCCLILVLVLVPAVPGAEPTGDLKKMQGTWEAVRFVLDGKELSARKRQSLRLTVTGRRGTFTKDGKTLHGTYRLDESARPRTLDILITSDGPEKGKKKLGIYELDGDRLRICVSPLEGRQRPEVFASKPGSGVWLEEWKRVR